MSKEDINNLLNDALEEGLKRRMVNAVGKVNELLDNLDKQCDREKIIKTLYDANVAISNLAMRNDDLYSEHEYHLFDGASGLWICQGREIKTTNRYD